MKRIIILLMTLLVSISVSMAQIKTKGSFSSLVTPQNIDFEIDFSSGTYKGLTYDELLDLVCPGTNQAEQWAIKASSLKGSFMHYFVERIAPKGYMIGSYKDGQTSYRLTMHINYVSPKGDVSATYIVTEISTGNVVLEFKDTSEGGMFGTFMNLFGDGLREAGDRAGKFFAKGVRRGK